MIEDLKLAGEDVATAVGERYDLAKVLDAAEAFLRGFVAEVALSCAVPTRPIFRFAYDAELPLDEAGYAALRRWYSGINARHDVIDANASAVVGPFRVSLRLLGDDDLFLAEGDAEPVTISGAPWRTLDPEPNLVVMPSGGSSPLFDPGAPDTVHALVRKHAPAGTDASGVARIPGLRFPHAAFGAGRGTLRIALMRTPKPELPESPDEETVPVEP